MNYLSESISPKFPFRDAFQKTVEASTKDFFYNRYRKDKIILKDRYFQDLRDLNEFSEKERLENSKNDYSKARLVWVEIKSTSKGASLKAHPESILDALLEKGDLRVKYGIISPILKCFKWAQNNGIDIPKKLDAKLYFWIADRPPWDVSRLPVFIPSAIPGELDLPLFPDVSFFYMQYEKKYTGIGVDLDKSKELFYRNPNSDLEDIVYFKGADTTKHNSDIRKSVVKDLKNHLPMENLDLSLQDGFTEFDPLFVDGLGKKYLLDLPGKFPWSVRFKFLFLFNNNPVVIKVNERWVASDDSWADSEKPWKQWIDTIIPTSSYLSITHTHIQLVKGDEKNKKYVDAVNKKSRDDTIKNISNLVKDKISAPDPNLGYKIMQSLTMDRIYQMIFRLVLTANDLYKV